MSLHTCNLDRDGIDTDVLRELPMNLIKKLAAKSSMKVDGYNDALKHAMKAKAGSEGKRLRDFIMEVPGIEVHIMQIEKMKKGGELYPEYPAKAKGNMGPKYVDTVNPVTTWSNNNKQNPATVASSIRPIKQAGGSIINDFGKELAIMPKTEGTEFNPMEYLQNYVQTTTLGGKYKNGGINWKKVPADQMFMLGLHKNGGVAKYQDGGQTNYNVIANIKLTDNELNTIASALGLRSYNIKNLKNLLNTKGTIGRELLGGDDALTFILNGKTTTMFVPFGREQDSADMSTFDQMTYGYEDALYNINPKTKEVFNASGEKVTDKTFVKNILANYKPKQTVTTQVPNPVTKTREQQQEEAATDLISSVVSTGAQLDKQNEQKVKESLKQQTTPVVYEDTRTQAGKTIGGVRKLLNNTVNKIAYGVAAEKVKDKVVDLFTRTDEEKAEREDKKAGEQKTTTQTPDKIISNSSSNNITDLDKQIAQVEKKLAKIEKKQSGTSPLKYVGSKKRLEKSDELEKKRKELLEQKRKQEQSKSTTEKDPEVMTEWEEQPKKKKGSKLLKRK